MHNTRMRLKTWFYAAYLLTTETPGMSAVQLQRQLGLKRYETTFNMLHKLRASMVNPFRDKIQGIVEVDETYVGGPKEGGKRGRGTKKALVIVAVENRNHRAGRIRMRHIKNASEKSVIPFIQHSISKKSIIVTDSFKSYGNLKQYGYAHESVLQQIPEKGRLSLIHIVISNLKTWIRGTFHGAVSPKHLQAYLNEYVYRFNRRFYPMSGFRSLLGLVPVVRYPTYKGLYKGRWKHPNVPMM
jgi:transposase-like protein